MAIAIPLKKKYTVDGVQSMAKKTLYRTRTGPRCCGPGCPSTRKKNARVVKRKDQ